MTATAEVTAEAVEDALAASIETAPSWITRDVLAESVRTYRAQTDAPPVNPDERRRAIVAAKDAAVAQLGERTGANADDLRATVEAALARPVSKAVDLGALMRAGVPPVRYMPGELGHRIAYDAGVTGFTGHPESGKTSLVGRLALDAIRAGRHVVYLDWEQGEAETVRRFAALGATAGELGPEHLTYLPFPGAPDWEQYGAIWDEHPGAVGVFDSSRGILRCLGLDEDRAAEVGRFMDPLVEFALTREVPCLLIDHVTKAATDTTGYARGSGDKLAAVQAQWYVKRVRPFSETEAGEVELVRWKARSGGLPRSHRFAVGDGEGNLTFRRLDADTSPQGRMDAAVIDYLRERAPEAASQREVEQNVPGTASMIRDRLKALAADEGRPIEAEESGRFTKYVYVASLDQEPAEELAF